MTLPALSLEGRVAVVVGGTSGIGLALARGLASLAHHGCTDRDGTSILGHVARVAARFDRHDPSPAGRGFLVAPPRSPEGLKASSRRSRAASGAPGRARRA